MRLPKNIFGNYTKPQLFLCETDKTKICRLETTETKASLKFNSYSELSFEVGRTYSDAMTGEILVNNNYDKIESPRIVYLEGIGYFEIQGPDMSSDGIKESKTITAYSLEYTLSQKYLTNFIINTGEIGSVEVTYADEKYHNISYDLIEPVVLYNVENKELSLLHLVLEKVYGWSIGHVDNSLKSMGRTFEVERESVYDFLMNDVCEKFNCYIVFDTIKNEINVYAESSTQKFIGDGSKTEFNINPPFEEIGTINVGDYKVTDYTYDPVSGKLILDKAPAQDSMIYVTDGTLSKWETDVFISFDNLSQEINVNYDADNIKTVLTVTGADGLDIREVNMGLPYIVDLSYFCTEDWLGKDLLHAYRQYLKDYDSKKAEYENNSQRINEIDEQILWNQNKMSSDNLYIVEFRPEVKDDTVGVFFVRGGDYPNYYYREVKLPEQYNANESYYLFEGEGINLTESDVENLYHALQDYFTSYFNDKTLNMESLNACAEYFSFAKNDFDLMCNELKNIKDYIDAEDIVAQNFESFDNKEFIFACINRFLSVVWDQLGTYPLEYCYKYVYDNLQTTAVEAGWGDVESDEYGKYLAVYLIQKSIDNKLNIKKSEIDALYEEMESLRSVNSTIGSSLDLDTYFKINYPDDHKGFMVRLSAFLREDEYTDDNFVQTGQETLEELYQLKKELKECGQIELNNLSQPKLQFSMTMANIYALPEFEPIIAQFKLGNVINVGIRPDCIKHSRLLQVDINFDDFSDFSCEFGELTSFKTQSDIQADLLSQAISAGKQVASNASYWDKGTDQANSIDLRIQQGLLDAATSIKSIDATQGVEIDNRGIHLRKINPETQEYDPEQGWLTNNKFLYSNDAFKTVKSVFGKYKIDDEEYWGLLAEAVIAGYVEGSKIRGGTIQIGELGNDKWSFEVDEDGNVSMLGGQVQFNTSKNSIAETENKFNNSINEAKNDLQGQIDQTVKEVEKINNSKMYSVEITTCGPTVISSKEDEATLFCKVYAWGTEITDTIPDDNFEWKRVSTDNEIDEDTGLTKDEVWNSMPEHQCVKSITIKAKDVIGNSSFICEVDLPE